MENKNADLSTLKINRTSTSESPGSKNKIIKILISIVVIILIIFGIISLWNILISPATEVNLVTASKISPSESDAILTGSGYVVAQRKASVASKATGRLVYLGVVEGDALKKGQIIARLEDNDIKAQLEQAKANLLYNEAGLTDAKNNYERQKKLVKSGATTQMQFDAADANYKRVLASIEVAKAQVTTAEVALENTLIRAPFDGTVLTKNADVGEIVSPLGASTTSRAAVVTMADMLSLQVEVDVSESNIQRIKAGQDCEITLDAYPDVRYPGNVDKIVPTADRSKATVLVKVAFKKYDSKVLPEMSTKVLFLKNEVDEKALDQKPILVVPFTAIRKINGKEYLYKVIDEKAKEIEVKTGKIIGDYTEIISGIDEGDKVIQKITDQIKDGLSVKVI